MAAIALPAAGVPRLVGIAVLALFAYAAWSYLSIGWADQKGDAWDGANRTLLYALAFALFALWRPRGRAAVALLIVYSLGVAAVGLVELLARLPGRPIRATSSSRAGSPRRPAT